MAADVEDAAVLVDAVDALGNLTADERHLLGIADDRNLASEQILFHLAENPGCADAGATHHHAINAITVKALLEALRCCHVTIADDGNRHSRVVLHLANEGPVGLPSVNL